MIEYLRLALATCIVLLPGRVAARALGLRDTASTVALGLACVFVAWTVVFTLHTSVRFGLAVLFLIGIALFLVARRVRRVPRIAGHPAVWFVGIVLGLLLWHVAGPVTGDGLFHLARVRKLVELPGLHLRSVDELAGGGLHPGYAFPLWHGFLAFVASLSGLDSGSVVKHEAAVLTPLACAVAWEAGFRLFRSRSLAWAVLLAQLGALLFAAGHGGSFASLSLPATASRLLLAPVALALVFGWIETRRRGYLVGVAAVFGELALVHPTYALFVLMPLVGYAALRPRDWRVNAAFFGAAVVPIGLAYLWLKPIVDETLSHNPGPGERLAGLLRYGNQLQVWNDHHYRMGPGTITRAGAVVILGFALIPLAGAAVRRRWGSFVLGGSLVILAVILMPELFPRFADAVSLSQARRSAGFIPVPFAVAGGLAVLCGITRATVPAAFIAGIALEIAYPGDFNYNLAHPGPAIVTWWAAIGGAGAVAAGFLVRRHRPFIERRWSGGVAAAVFVLPVAISGFIHWNPSERHDPGALSPALVQALRELPAQAVVLADTQTSYRIAALRPVYLVAAPPTHVANTRSNDPYGRYREVEHWLATGDPAVPKKYGATWAVRGSRLYRLSP